jgi:hypothetical protein
LELAVRSVQNDGFSILELDPEYPAQTVVRSLRQTRGIEGGLTFPGVVVNIEVGCLDDLEIEGSVLKLVAAELAMARLGQTG